MAKNLMDYTDGEEITSKVNAREYVVDGDKVTLEGQVPAWHERAIAEKAAWSAAGVSAVDDRIQVK